MGLHTLLMRHNHDANVESSEKNALKDGKYHCGKHRYSSDDNSNKNRKRKSIHVDSIPAVHSIGNDHPKHQKIKLGISSNDDFGKTHSCSDVTMVDYTLDLSNKGPEISSQAMVSPLKSTNSKKTPCQPGIRVIKLKDKSWMCNVCRKSIFNNFADACRHEVSCKLKNTKMEECNNPTLSDEQQLHKVLKSNDIDPQQSLRDQTITGFESHTPYNVKRQWTKNERNYDTKKLDSNDYERKANRRERVLDIKFVPESKTILSEYNYFLTQNIEFFEVTTSFKLNECQNLNASDVTSRRIGLRCTHCSTRSMHVSAASFFPSTTNSIASGIGTIGARHFAGGKCPFISQQQVEQMRLSKKLSQQQTRIQGKVGLDAYCRDLVERENIVNNQHGGIFIAMKTRDKRENGDVEFSKKNPVNTGALNNGQVVPNDIGINLRSQKSKYDHIMNLVDSNDNAVDSDKEGRNAFIPSRLELFWECKYCNSLPNAWRAHGSIIFSATNPSLSKPAKDHLRKCTGKTALRIPRSASFHCLYGTDAQRIKVCWEKSNAMRKADSITKNNYTGDNNIRKKKDETFREIKDGLEDILLARPDDLRLTTEFAHFTVSQLKKCYLTKAGGSRGACPLGYPGLACLHCAGDNPERRFFYTSSDHLRNSFSHIPSHLAKCKKCPIEVKQRLDALKLLRNQHKSQLKAGSHKLFIDTVWERLHGFDNMVQANEKGEKNENDDDASISSVSIESGKFEQDCFEDLHVEYIESILTSSKERCLTTDFVYYSVLQLEPTAIKDDRKFACRHCYAHMGEGITGESIFDFSSQDHIRRNFSIIPRHLLKCVHCPEKVKTKLKLFQQMRSVQESAISHNSHISFIELIWNRLQTIATPRKISSLKLTKEPKLTDKNKVVSDFPKQLSNTTNKKYNVSLVCEDDRSYVSDFTFYTMQQMTSTNLEASGNGARSTFEYGFPGLACIHCYAKPNSRKFFYRTAEILSGI